MKKMKVLMLGTARNVKGGMTTVVNNYFKCGLENKVDLEYIETINDKNKFLKLIKIICGYIEFLIKVKKCDIVHIHMASRRSTFRKAKYARIAKKNNKKVILHIHGGEFKIFYNDECSEKQKKYIEETLKLADKVIVLSEEWKEFFSNLVDESKIEVIYNSITVPNSFEKNTETEKILFLGKFVKNKGIYDLLDVMKRICKEYPHLKLYLGGDGEIEKVRKIVKEYKLENNVKILGWISGKEKEMYLKDVSIYILPSYHEGMPMSVLEGMAYKNITISTGVGGIPKVINNMENGILIEPGDKENMYIQLKKILEDKNLRIKLSNNARKTICDKFDIEKNIEKLINLYEM